MDDIKQPEDAKPAPPEWIKSDRGFHEIYTNFVHSNWSLYDVRVRLGQLVPDPKSSDPATSKWVVEERAAVTFAWPQAKILRDLLIELVAKYEEANGEIQPIKMPLAPTTAKT